MTSVRGKILFGGDSDFEKETIGLGEFFFKQANKYGDRILQIDPISNKQETYKSINIKSVRLALNLKQFNITPSDVIVSCLSNRKESIIPHLATLFLDAIICALDPSQSQREYMHCLNLVQPKIIFVEEKCLNVMEQAIKILQKEPIVIVVGESEKYKTLKHFQNKLPEEEEFKPSVCRNCHECASIFFSSGTTGLSKAVCISHYALLNGTKNYSLADSFDLKTVLYYSSLYWSYHFILLTAVYHVGGCIIIPGPYEPRMTLQIIERYKVTFLPICSWMIDSFLEALHQESYDLSSVHSITFAGSIAKPAKLQKLRNFFGTNRVTSTYGMTEAGVACILFDYTRDKDGLDKIRSSGRCIKDTEVKIVDTNSKQLLGPFEKGELLMKSPYLSMGYYNTDLSVAFDEDGFLKSGDIAYYDDEGYVYIMERIKEIFQYQDHPIVPSFSEAILLEHPDLKDAIVFGIPHERDRNWPAALVVLKDGSSATEEEIQEFYSKRVSDNHKLRGGLKIVNSLDRTATGKLKRNELKEKFLADSATKK